MKHRIGVLLLSLVIGLSPPRAAWAATLEALLLGSNEVPGPGMADGSALALVVVDGTQVTVSIEQRGFGGLTAVHIHKGEAGVAGALVAEFPWSFPPDGSFPRSSIDPPPGGPLAVQSASPPAPLPVDRPAAQQLGLAVTGPDPAARESSLGETPQTITFAAPPPKTYGDPDFRLSASASSGLPLTFTAWGDCTVSGSYVRILAAGGCWLEAQQPGDSNFAAAPVVDRQFSIAKADQTISFPDLGDSLPAGFVITLSVSASSRLPVDLTARGACLFSRVTSTLSGLGAGSCTVTAEQPGDPNFNPAPGVTRTFPIITVFEFD